MKDFLFKANNIWKPLIASLTSYSIILLIFGLQGVKPLLVLRDLAQTCDEGLGVGFISNIGIIMWIGISFVLIFLSKISFLRKSHYRNLITLGAVFSSILALDDFFLIHDKYIIQEIVFIFYFLFALNLIKKCRRQIEEIDGYLFCASYILFGLSIFIDIVLQNLFPSLIIYSQILEEGFKFAGIFCWFAFWWKSANFILRNELDKQYIK